MSKKFRTRKTTHWSGLNRAERMTLKMKSDQDVIRMLKLQKKAFDQKFEPQPLRHRITKYCLNLKCWFKGCWWKHENSFESTDGDNYAIACFFSCRRPRCKNYYVKAAQERGFVGGSPFMNADMIKEIGKDAVKKQ